ncbi:4Fe-4S dicluster domain-containing protein [Streptomyces chromofuscus]|uniref:4Fe-4S dicluster domain-containing protein n=1 Tax=Streptomyces chromofuscus TaxID=42881 RepID=A0A7M2TBG0_STRCW|nr:4Fe-4S dicluster domain-containing protein [Streptomyces chromofuscus]QOV44681.1 4Fe-4S dicluster domain-containing protein [Streptomyces chromofuscus]GGT01171.1 4Fe-4S ferredoxin [Streptomyces chromofuscus]
MSADTDVNAVPSPEPEGLVMGKDGMAALVDVLVRRGFTVVGPTVRDGAIVLAELLSADELPYGWGVELEAGRYRLRERSDGAAFANAAGPQSWKSFLHPARVREWSADRVEGELVLTADQAAPPRYAFLGVRPCDLRAIAIQDRVLTGGAYRDPTYAGRRSGALLIVVECTEPGATCFCVSMGTGPAAGPGYDLVMTEVVDGDGHRFWVRSGSEEGAEILAEVPARLSDPETRETARAAVTAAADRMGRTMPEADLRELMAGTLDAPRWDDVAGRCLTCGNCTMVCPTCFCTTTEDVTDLTGDHAERWRLWDSCFDLDFSHLHGGPVRASARSRYRQWMTHKLGTWYDQFGSSGCVGCGRCIVWCPVGIDITEEAAALHDWTAAESKGG